MFQSELFEWLKTIRCEKFVEKLSEIGCETVEELQFVTAEDLDELGIKRIQKRRILARLEELNESSYSSVPSECFVPVNVNVKSMNAK
jgi:DNA-directed RNA polymerase subunit N (RpoN/RPB10)